MRRWLLAAAAAWLALAALGAAWERLVQRRRDAAGAIRTLVPAGLEVRGIDIGHGGRTWRYVREGGLWRYPAYHDAYAPADRLAALVRTLAGCTGTALPGGAPTARACGLEPAARLELTLRDVQGRALAVLHVGGSVPGTSGREAYLRLGEAGPVFHGHVNPWLSVGSPPQTLIERRLLAARAGGRPLVELGLEGPEQGAGLRLRRESAGAGRPGPGAPARRWVAVRAGVARPCAEESVQEYLDFLHEARFVALAEPKAFVAAAPGRRVWWRDEDGRADTLEIGAAAGPGEVYVRWRGARHAARVPAAVARLLVPPDTLLLRPQAPPTPFARARRAEADRQEGP